MKPILSVVIITKNEEKNIQRTIDSCTKISPLEIIVVDSNSSDNTREIVLENSKNNQKIKLFLYSTPPFTAARGRHIGTQKVSEKCTHILFLDGDMEIHPEFIQQGLNALLSDPQLSIVMGQMNNYYYDDQMRLASIENSFYNLEKHIIGGAMIASREAYIKSGGFNIELVVNEESELEYRLNRLGLYAKRLPELMVTHHTEAPGSKAQFRSRISSRRITALGINLFFGLRDLGYLKRLASDNIEIFASLAFLICLATTLYFNFYLALGASTATYLLFIKHKRGKIGIAANFCVYAMGMLLGFILKTLEATKNRHQ